MAARKKEKKLDSWIIGQCFAMREKYGPCQEFRLMHIGVGGNTDGIIETFPVSADYDESQLNSLTDAILQSALADATTMGHTQKYAIQAIFLVDAELVSMARFTIAQQAGDGEEVQDGIQSTEPANTQGLLAQNQRHLESTMRMNLQMATGTMAALQGMNERYARQIDTMLEEKFKTAELLSDLLDKKAERDTRAKDADVAIAMKTKAAENFMPMLPTILNKLMGGKFLPEGRMKDGLKTFAESLTPEQIDAMMAPLNDAQKAAMAEVLIEVQTGGQTPIPEEDKQ